MLVHLLIVLGRRGVAADMEEVIVLAHLITVILGVEAKAQTQQLQGREPVLKELVMVELAIVDQVIHVAVLTVVVPQVLVP